MILAKAKKWNGKQPRRSISLSQALRRYCKQVEFKRFAPRDLRRTWKTLAGSIGLSLEIRNRIQGHGLTDVGSKHYDRWAYLKEKRVAMQAWTNWLQETVTGKRRESNVVEMEVRRG